jgi:hypothetical protein
MALKNIDTNDLGSIFSALLGSIGAGLQTELDASRITKSEYGDIIKNVMPHIISLVPNLYSLDFDIENKKIDNQIKREELKIAKEKLKNEQNQNKFLKAQIESFENKVLLEIFAEANRSWGLMLSSGLIDITDDNGNLTATIPDYLTNENMMDVYNKLRERGKAPNND